MEKIPKLAISVGIILVIIGISLAFYGYTQHQIYKDIWWNSDDLEEKNDAWNKMEYYSDVEFAGIGLLFAGISLLFVGGGYHLQTREKRVKSKEYRVLDKNQENLIETRISKEEKTETINQTIICPYCGSEVKIDTSKQNLGGKIINCKVCNSDISF